MIARLSTYMFLGRWSCSLAMFWGARREAMWAGGFAPAFFWVKAFGYNRLKVVTSNVTSRADSMLVNQKVLWFMMSIIDYCV